MTTCCSSPESSISPGATTFCRPSGSEPLEQVVPDAEGVRHRGEGRVHGADARKDARVDDVEVVELVRAAVRVQDGRGWVAAHATRAGLVRAAGDRDLVLHVREPVEQVARIQVELSEQGMEL